MNATEKDANSSVYGPAGQWTPEFDKMVAADPILSRAASIICGAACGMYSACNSREAAVALRNAGLLSSGHGSAE